MKAACERMNRVREEIRELLGEQSIAGNLMRGTDDRP